MAEVEDRANGLGAKLAGKVSEQVVRATVSARERLGGQTVRVGMALQEEFFRLVGGELNRTVGPLWAKLGDEPEMPQWVRDTGAFVGAGKGQWASMLGGVATGAAMGSGLMKLIENEMTPGIAAIMSKTPFIRLSPDQTAQAEVRGLISAIDPALEVAGQGLNAERWGVLQQLHTGVLGPSEIVELTRRGHFGVDDAKRFMHRAGFDGHHAGELLKLRETLLSLPEASQMWNRSIVSTDELHTIAMRNGYSVTDADRYAELGGEPPAPELLYGAFRRGIIDTDRLRRGITQGPIRNEWFDVLEQMQFRSMTPDQAAGAVTQGHLDVARGRAIAQEYGLNPADFEVLIETAGRPPGVDFATEALNRGFIGESEFDVMFLESALKNRYLPLLKAMRVRLMPQETARSMLAKGVMTVERCTTILKSHGYNDEDVATFIEASTAEKQAPTRDLSLSAVRELYAEQEISPEDATAMLTGLGFSEQEAQWELDLADLARVRSFRNAVITRIRAGYVKGLLDEGEAGTTLDTLAVPPARRDTLLQLWDIERETVTRDLTPAQLVSAAKKALMPATVALQRLVGQGYAQSDAVTLLKISGVAGV